MTVTEPEEVRAARIRAVSFDCYGTLVDWEAVARGAFERILRAVRADPGRAEALGRRWERVQLAMIGGPYRRYRDVLRDSLERTLAEAGLPVPGAERDALVRAIPDAEPFPDARPAIERLRALGLATWIVSNQDDDLLARTLARLDAPISGTITAEQARAYKPDRAPFRLLLQRVGLAAGQVLHAAFGFDYDIRTAHGLGFRTVWVNRSGSPLPPGAPEPDAIIAGLEALPGIAEQMARVR